MDFVAKKILNALKCPVCQSQIDILNWVVPKIGSKKGHNFGCVSDHFHYSIFFMHWELPIRIEKETVIIYEGKYQYEIAQDYFLSGISFPHTHIYIRVVDAEKRILDNHPIKEIGFNKILFDFSKTNREKLVNRVKTILVFQ